jgi:4-hydroxybenzoate polyprenyltransferase
MNNQSNCMEPIKAQRNPLDCLSKETYFSMLKALKPLTSTPLLLSLNGVMVVVFGFFLYNLTIKPSLLLAAFLVTFSVYGLNKVTDKAEDSINNKNFPNASKYYLILSVASIIIGLFLGTLSGSLTTFILFLPVIIGLIYSVRISKSIPRLKEIVGVKSIVVAISWALTGCLLPISAGLENLQVGTVVFFYIFIRILIGTILCDVLDKKGDCASGIETIPIKLGQNKTKKLLLVLNSVGLFLSIFCITTQMLSYFIPILLFGVIYGYITIGYVFKENHKNSIAGLILDSEWFPIVAIGSLLIR